MKNWSTLLLLLLTLGEIWGKGVSDRMEDYLQTLVQDGAFSGSVLVAQGEEVIHAEGYGQAVIEYLLPNTSETRFRIGSITKQFTAMAIMQLVEAGKICLDGKLADYLPQYPKIPGQQVTIHQLLNHSSGIPSYTNMEDVMKHRGSLLEAPEDFIKHFWDKELKFKPGSKFRYNNSGYYLLGMIIEKVSGQTFDDYLATHIFNPLNMTCSGVEHYREVIPNMAVGYTAIGDYPEKASHFITDIAGAAGSVYSTTGDLLTWHRALRQGELISRESYEKIFTPYLNKYGYGWTISREDDQIVYQHGGGIDGFRATAILIPKDGLSIIVLSNLEVADTKKIAHDLRKIMIGEPLEIPYYPAGANI